MFGSSLNFFDMNIINLLIALFSYLLGSLPFALIIVRLTSGKDVRKEGSGNVGAMNSFDVTKKKWIGILVLILDVLKGVVAVLFARMIGDGFPAIAIAAIFSVLGHNFSIYIKFRGGRGLATAAGAFIMINPLIVIFWILMYFAGWFIIKKNVHIANLTASICAPLMIYYTPQLLLDRMSFAGHVPVMNLLITGAIVSFLIILRHIKPLMELMKNSDELKKLRK